MGAETGLSEREAEIIRETYPMVLSDHKVFAARLFDRLFKVAPETRPMFSNTIEIQREKFAATLLTIVISSANRAPMDETLRTLGRNHRDYGVNADHYELFGDVFMWTLKDLLGNRFDTEAENAWRRFYDVAADRMQRH